MTKAFHNVTIQDDDRGDQRVYVAADVVAHDEYFRSRVIENALREIRRWQEKYREYKELELYDLLVLASIIRSGWNPILLIAYTVGVVGGTYCATRISK